MRELECKRELLMMALISGADVFVPAFELQDDIIIIIIIIISVYFSS